MMNFRVIIWAFWATQFTAVVSAGSGGSCIDITLPGVSGLKQCLDDSRVECDSSQKPLHILSPVVTCVFKVLADAGSTDVAVKTYKNVIAAIVAANSNPLALSFRVSTNQIQGTVNLKGCDGTVSVSLPKDVAGKCKTDLSDACDSPAEKKLTSTLVSGVLCFVKNGLQGARDEDIKDLICDVTGAIDDAGGVEAVLLGSVIRDISNEICRNLTIVPSSQPF
ncbi:uncharacterized protein LOC144175884 isoform X1 [Haemaphysalis longicornis]